MISDNAVIELLTWNNSLRDTLLVGVHITRNTLGEADVVLNFNARPDSEFSEIEIRFTDVIELEFGYDQSDAFLNVCDLKFIKLKDDTFYLSLDPDPSTLPEAGVTDVQAAETDHFFVRAHSVQAWVTKRN